MCMYCLAAHLRFRLVQQVGVGSARSQGCVPVPQRATPLPCRSCSITRLLHTRAKQPGLRSAHEALQPVAPALGAGMAPRRRPGGGYLLCHGAVSAVAQRWRGALLLRLLILVGLKLRRSQFCSLGVLAIRDPKSLKAHDVVIERTRRQGATKFAEVSCMQLQAPAHGGDVTLWPGR